MLSYTLFCLVMVAQVMCRGYNHRIVQGNEAKEGQFPYQVYVSYFVEDKGFSNCGGSIISKRFILTAGHCISDESINDPYILIVTAGSIDRESGTEINITRALRHPDYNKHTHNNNDIAILTVETDIEFTDNIKPIHLPAKGGAVTGDLTISGWGLTQADNTSSISPKLLYANVPVVDNEKCKEAYGSSQITENMFCAGTGGSDACGGDSGGPAAQDGILVGIVSWGEGCGTPLKPGVYANVASPSIRDFITENTEL